MAAYLKNTATFKRQIKGRFYKNDLRLKCRKSG